MEAVIGHTGGYPPSSPLFLPHDHMQKSNFVSDKFPLETTQVGSKEDVHDPENICQRKGKKG